MIFKYQHDPVFNLLRKIRGGLVRLLRPRLHYFLFATPMKSVRPISIMYGFDRGKPIDRYYIEKFLYQHADSIQGVCLEITDATYTKKYGGSRVTKSEVLDIDKNNKNATIYGDLRKLRGIKANTYDCLIITQTLVMIDDYQAAIKECKRILKPGGTLLVTMPCLSPVWNINNHMWRFTSASAKYIFNKFFSEEKLQIKTYGNALSGQAFWVGMAIEDLTQKELDHNDPYFPVIVTVAATK